MRKAYKYQTRFNSVVKQFKESKHENQTVPIRRL